MRTGIQILANIAMFMPLGYLLASLQKKNLPVLLAALLLSACIEVLQLILARGFFEWDDLINNTIGAILGWGLYRILWAVLPKKRASALMLLSNIGVVIVCAVLFAGAGVETPVDSSSRWFCFQIDAYESGKLTGFAFQYDRKPGNYTISLRSMTTGKRIKLNTACGLARPDVEQYFTGGYENTGFQAEGNFDPAEEYEVLIRWPWLLASVPAGAYISSANVHYSPEGEFTAPAMDADYVQKGTLRVYRPDYHCWVYQYEGSLYWIADQHFAFEADGSTYIHCQLWTTQTDKLPKHRLDNNWLLDDLGSNFEKYEIEGENGYRVMKRALPTEYSVTSIVTGYHKDGKWIWQNYFRPVYDF